MQAVLAWAVGWKSMATCSEIMQCRKKLKCLKCAEYISASENHFKKKLWGHEFFFCIGIILNFNRSLKKLSKKYIITLIPVLFLWSCSGEADHAKNVHTSLANWLRVAGVPSSYSII